MLTVNGLKTTFTTARGTVHAVNGVSFTVRRGETVGIVGESGSGKSVTVQSILALVPPPGRVVGGSVNLDGQDIMSASRAQLRRIRGSQIGLAVQNPFGALNPILRIESQFHNVIAAHEKTSRKSSKERALATLQAMGIPDPERVLRGYAHELSGGMAQRVVIGLVMVLGPKILIADEPTTALDVTVQRRILDLIRDLMHKEGLGVLLVTHDLSVVANYCDRVAVMYAGKIVEMGDVPQVLARPLHPYTQALLKAVPSPGQPLVNLPGLVPDLIDYPAGCPFSARCPVAVARCNEDVPHLEPFDDSRSVSCHLVRTLPQSRDLSSPPGSG